jgi:hypothetical protein
MNLPFMMASRQAQPTQPSPASPAPSQAPPAPSEPPAEQQPDPDLEALMSRAAAPTDNSIFLDRNDEGTATALSGPDGQTQQQLPIEAFPPGAQEGQTFDPADVNLRGGKGNPFAEPISTSPGASAPPDLGNNSLPNSGSVFIPPRDIRGTSMTMQPAQGGGRWEARLPDGQVITVDPNEARAARRDEVAQQLRDIDTALADPSTAINPQVIGYLTVKKRSLLADLSPAEIKQVYGQAGAMEKQGAQIASNEGMQANRLASQEKVAAENNATRRATSKYGHGGGSNAKMKAAAAADPSEDAASPWAQLDSKERTREGNRLNRELRDWTNMHGWTKLLSTNPGRLDWAKDNIAMTGPGAGAAQAEAMMNLFGVARGGVPVKNETQEFYKATTSLTTHLDDLGKHIGLPQLGTRWKNGTLTGEEAQKYEEAVSAMPEDQRFAIARAIQSTSDALMKYGRKELQSLKTLWDEEPLPNRYKATAFINEMGAHLDLPPTQWWGDVRLRGKSSSNAPGAAPGKAGGSTLDSKLDALNKALGL